jgi:hypothetical protein
MISDPGFIRYNIMFVSDLRQVGGFLFWTSPIRQLLYSMFNLFDLLAPKDIHVV